MHSFVCLACGKGFKYEHSLNFHVKSYHSSDVTSSGVTLNNTCSSSSSSSYINNSNSNLNSGSSVFNSTLQSSSGSLVPTPPSPPTALTTSALSNAAVAAALAAAVSAVTTGSPVNSCSSPSSSSSTSPSIHSAHSNVISSNYNGINIQDDSELSDIERTNKLAQVVASILSSSTSAAAAAAASTCASSSPVALGASVSPFHDKSNASALNCINSAAVALSPFFQHAFPPALVTGDTSNSVTAALAAVAAAAARDDYLRKCLSPLIAPSSSSSSPASSSAANDKSAVDENFVSSGINSCNSSKFNCYADASPVMSNNCTDASLLTSSTTCTNRCDVNTVSSVKVNTASNASTSSEESGYSAVDGDKMCIEESDETNVARNSSPNNSESMKKSGGKNVCNTSSSNRSESPFSQSSSPICVSNETSVDGSSCVSLTGASSGLERPSSISSKMRIKKESNSDDKNNASPWKDEQDDQEEKNESHETRVDDEGKKIDEKEKRNGASGEREDEKREKVHDETESNSSKNFGKCNATTTSAMVSESKHESNDASSCTASSRNNNSIDSPDERTVLSCNPAAAAACNSNTCTDGGYCDTNTGTAIESGTSFTLANAEQRDTNASHELSHVFSYGNVTRRPSHQKHHHRQQLQLKLQKPPPPMLPPLNTHSNLLTAASSDCNSTCNSHRDHEHDSNHSMSDCESHDQSTDHHADEKQDNVHSDHHHHTDNHQRHRHSSNLHDKRDVLNDNQITAEKSPVDYNCTTSPSLVQETESTVTHESSDEEEKHQQALSLSERVASNQRIGGINSSQSTAKDTKPHVPSSDELICHLSGATGATATAAPASPVSGASTASVKLPASMATNAHYFTPSQVTGIDVSNSGTVKKYDTSGLTIKSEKALICMLEGYHETSDQSYLLYKCCQCGLAFPSFPLVSSHISSVHFGNDVIELSDKVTVSSNNCCKLCGAIFKWRSQLILHESLHKTFECQLLQQHNPSSHQTTSQGICNNNDIPNPNVNGNIHSDDSSTESLHRYKLDLDKLASNFANFNQYAAGMFPTLDTAYLKRTNQPTQLIIPSANVTTESSTSIATASNSTTNATAQQSSLIPPIVSTSTRAATSSPACSISSSAPDKGIDNDSHPDCHVNRDVNNASHSNASCLNGSNQIADHSDGSLCSSNVKSTKRNYQNAAAALSQLNFSSSTPPLSVTQSFSSPSSSSSSSASSAASSCSIVPSNISSSTNGTNVTAAAMAAAAAAASAGLLMPSFLPPNLVLFSPFFNPSAAAAVQAAFDAVNVASSSNVTSVSPTLVSSGGVKSNNNCTTSSSTSSSSVCSVNVSCTNSITTSGAASTTNSHRERQPHSSSNLLATGSASASPASVLPSNTRPSSVGAPCNSYNSSNNSTSANGNVLTSPFASLVGDKLHTNHNSHNDCSDHLTINGPANGTSSSSSPNATCLSSKRKDYNSTSLSNVNSKNYKCSSSTLLNNHQNDLNDPENQILNLSSKNNSLTLDLSGSGNNSLSNGRLNCNSSHKNVTQMSKAHLSSHAGSSSSVSSNSSSTSSPSLTASSLEAHLADVSKVPPPTPPPELGEIEETAPGQFKCRYCDKTFDRIFSVHRHERVHTGYKPCVCKVCGRGFSEKRNLRHHIIRFHSDGSGRELLKRARKDKSISITAKSFASVLKQQSDSMAASLAAVASNGSSNKKQSSSSNWSSDSPSIESVTLASLAMAANSPVSGANGIHSGHSLSPFNWDAATLAAVAAAAGVNLPNVNSNTSNLFDDALAKTQSLLAKHHSSSKGNLADLTAQSLNHKKLKMDPSHGENLSTGVGSRERISQYLTSPSPSGTSSHGQKSHYQASTKRDLPVNLSSNSTSNSELISSVPKSSSSSTTNDCQVYSLHQIKYSNQVAEVFKSKTGHNHQHLISNGNCSDNKSKNCFRSIGFDGVNLTLNSASDHKDYLSHNLLINNCNGHSKKMSDDDDDEDTEDTAIANVRRFRRSKSDLNGLSMHGLLGDKENDSLEKLDRNRKFIISSDSNNNIEFSDENVISVNELSRSIALAASAKCTSGSSRRRKSQPRRKVVPQSEENSIAAENGDDEVMENCLESVNQRDKKNASVTCASKLNQLDDGDYPADDDVDGYDEKAQMSNGTRMSRSKQAPVTMQDEEDSEDAAMLRDNSRRRRKTSSASENCCDRMNGDTSDTDDQYGYTHVNGNDNDAASIGDECSDNHDVDAQMTSGMKNKICKRKRTSIGKRKANSVTGTLEEKEALPPPPPSACATGETVTPLCADQVNEFKKVKRNHVNSSAEAVAEDDVNFNGTRNGKSLSECESCADEEEKCSSDADVRKNDDGRSSLTCAMKKSTLASQCKVSKLSNDEDDDGNNERLMMLMTSRNSTKGNDSRNCTIYTLSRSKSSSGSGNTRDHLNHHVNHEIEPSDDGSSNCSHNGYNLPIRDDTHTAASHINSKPLDHYKQQVHPLDTSADDSLNSVRNDKNHSTDKVAKRKSERDTKRTPAAGKINSIEKHTQDTKYHDDIDSLTAPGEVLLDTCSIDATKSVQDKEFKLLALATERLRSVFTATDDHMQQMDCDSLDSSADDTLVPANEEKGETANHLASDRLARGESVMKQMIDETELMSATPCIVKCDRDDGRYGECDDSINESQDVISDDDQDDDDSTVHETMVIHCDDDDVIGNASINNRNALVTSDEEESAGEVDSLLKKSQVKSNITHEVLSECNNESSNLSSNSNLPFNCTSINSSTSTANGSSKNSSRLKNHGAFFSSYSPRLDIVEKPIKRNEACRPLLGPDGKYLYPCGYCSKNFCSLSDLNRHMNFHEDVRPFKCEFCDYQSRTNSQLKVHMMRHAGIKQYLCQTCNYNGVTQSDLNRHCKTRCHILRTTNACSICLLGFSTRTLLLEHLMKCHNDLPEDHSKSLSNDSSSSSSSSSSTCSSTSCTSSSSPPTLSSNSPQQLTLHPSSSEVSVANAS